MICPKCGGTERVGVSARRPNGRCRHCANAQARARKTNNPEKAKAAVLAWKTNNPEKYKAAVLAWKTNNPEKYKADRIAWKTNNPEKHKAIRARSHAKELLRKRSKALSEDPLLAADDPRSKEEE
jgi:hypothetical protein